MRKFDTKHPYSIIAVKLLSVTQRNVVMTAFEIPDDDQPLTLRQQQALARRKQILETAQRLFTAQGFSSTTTKQIAEELGVAESLIFHYFPTKASLVSAIARQPGIFHSEFIKFLEAAHDRPAREVLEELLKIWIQHIWAGRDLFGVLLAELQSNVEVATAFQSETEAMIEELSAYLHSRVQLGELQASTPTEALARMFLSAVLMFFLVHRFDSKEAYLSAFTKRAHEMRALWQVWFAVDSSVT